ncbi:MAG TPA: lysophospholipid acyltransferase family protein [Ferruginibacter sp.]|jgi:1-acyl-sn-glycerol-3-phosphate acyltransferase|nr:lysophospholipid acyltransferase family protein [Ferruginibacter sp.]
MKVIKDIFARIWCTWAAISFIVTFIIIFIPTMVPYLVPDPKGQYYFIKVSRVWMWTWLRLVGCPLKVKGKENFKPDTTYVIVYNHNAYLDVPLSAPFVPGPNKTIAKASLAKIPVFKWFYERGSVLVDRDSDSSRRKSFEDMKKVLQRNIHMCIYPEGTRNTTKEPMKKFFDGAFKLAVDTKKDVIPCVILGTRKANPADKSFYFLPKKLEMHFLPPVSSENISGSELRSKVFEIMKKHYIENEK